MTTRALLIVAAVALPASALAQHEGYDTHGREAAPPPAPLPAEDHSAHGTDQASDRPDPAAQDHATHPAAAEPVAAPADAHAGHGGAVEANAPHVGHGVEAPTADDEHAGHALSDGVSPPVAGPPAEAFSGPEHAADAFFGDAAMAVARRDMARMHGGVTAHRVLIDRLEARVGDGADRYLFDAQAWLGGDIDKLWLKAEGEGTLGGAFGGAEIQALWGRAIGPWFDLQAGVRYDIGPGADRGHLVLGVQGLAPYWIELEASAFLSDQGDLTARFEAEHDMRLTQRLILQPRAELDFALPDNPAKRTGAGFSRGAFGIRLRYQVTPLVAPYIGVEYDRTFGETRRLSVAAGEDPGGFRFLAGLRTSF